MKKSLPFSLILLTFSVLFKLPPPREITAPLMVVTCFIMEDSHVLKKLSPYFEKISGMSNFNFSFKNSSVSINGTPKLCERARPTVVLPQPIKPH